MDTRTPLRKGGAAGFSEQQAGPLCVEDTCYRPCRKDARVSLRALIWAMSEAAVSNVNEWAILVTMADVANDEGRGSYLSIDTIAARTHLSRSTVIRHRASLIESGLIYLSDDVPPSLMAIPEEKRPVCFDLNVGGVTLTRGVTLTPKPTTTTTKASDADEQLSGRQHQNLDATDEPMEDAPTQPVTPCNQDITWTTVHLLKTWFNVNRQEQVDAWRQAWRTAVQVASEGYDPDTHLVTYLTRCHHDRRDAKPGVWLKFLIEDRHRFLAEQKAQQDQREQASGDGGESWALGTLKHTPKWEGSEQ